MIFDIIYKHFFLFLTPINLHKETKKQYKQEKIKSKRIDSKQP